MSKLDSNLSEIFDCEFNEVETLPVAKENELIEVQDESDDDFVLVRNNINNLIEKGNTAIDNLLNVAKETEHPRAYEVAANFLKTMSDLNKDLLDVHKRKKELTGKSDDKADSKTALIDKAVFIGSTNDLITLIKERK
jgi:hypothetical protein